MTDSESKLELNHAQETNGHAKPAYSGQPDDLHDLISVPNVDDEDPLAAMRNDPKYAALIQDLEYIASEVHRLFAPAEETPSDALWDKIQSQLPAKPNA